MAKVKNKRNSGLADRVINKKKGDITKKKLNPFEVHINREKIKVLGQKSKHDRGLPGVSRSKAIKKRKETLGVEMKLMNKTNTFIDRRIGEKDNQLSSDDKNLARFAAERAKQHSKKNIYNLADDEVLTHRGQTLEQIEKFDDPRSSDDEDDDGRKAFGGLNDEFVAESHFGGGILSKTEKDGAKSHKDLIEQLIAESKKRKHEKQKEKEQTLDLTEKLDSEWRDLQPVVMKRMKVDEEGDKQDYDKVMRELKFDRRGTPSDGLKSQEKKEKEDKKRLEELEREREQRMLGEENTTRVVPSKGKHRSAEDLDDNFALDEEPDFMLAYDNDGNPLVPEHILKANHVPNSKKQFNDGISDSSSEDDGGEESEDDDEESDEENEEKEINKVIGEPDKDTILFQKNDDSSDDDDDDDDDDNDSSDDGENEVNVTEKNKNVDSNKAVTATDKNETTVNSNKIVEVSSSENSDSDEVECDVKSKKITVKENQEKNLHKEKPAKLENTVENKQKEKPVENQKVVENYESESESGDQEMDQSGDETKNYKNNFENYDDLVESESSDEESNNEADVNISRNLNLSFDNDESESGEESSGDDDENKVKSNKKNMTEFSMTYTDFKKSLTNKNPKLQSEILEKLIKKYDPSLAVNNKDILSKIYAYSLQYINDIFTKLSTESDIIKSFLIFNKIVPFLYDLVHTNKISTKTLLIEVLKEKHEQFKKKPRRVPDLDTLIFFKLASLIYPTSDFKHPVTTPCFVFMSEILTLSKFRDAYSISRGLFLIALVLEFTVLSKRLVPAALNFLKGVLYLAANTSILNPVQIIPPFNVHKDTKILMLKENCKKMRVEHKMSAKDLVSDLDDTFKIRTVFTSVAMLKEFFELLNDIEAPDYLFDSHLNLINRIDLDNYPNNFVEYLEKNVKEMRLVLEMKTYTPLAREKKRPKALRLYEPDVQEVFTGNKNWKLSKEQVERNKLKSKYKKEMKGAIRELRRDKAYVASVKIKEKIKRDNVRREKVKQIYKEASIQQGELNKMKRMK